jgi:hypothetical protein
VARFAHSSDDNPASRRANGFDGGGERRRKAIRHRGGKRG